MITRRAPKACEYEGGAAGSAQDCLKCDKNITRATLSGGRPRSIYDDDNLRRYLDAIVERRDDVAEQRHGVKEFFPIFACSCHRPPTGAARSTARWQAPADDASTARSGVFPIRRHPDTVVERRRDVPASRFHLFPRNKQVFSLLIIPR